MFSRRLLGRTHGRASSISPTKELRADNLSIRCKLTAGGGGGGIEAPRPNKSTG